MSSRHLRGILLLAALTALGSCASLRLAGDRGAASRVARLLASRDAAELSRISGSPFLIDGEVVPLPDDVAGFWRAVAQAGWKLEPGLVGSAPAAPAEWRGLDDSMEVRAFFKNYVDERCRILELSASSGGEALLLVRERLFSLDILGFRGPR